MSGRLPNPNNLFALCALCGEQKVIIRGIKVFLHGKRGEPNEYKCIGCHRSYFFWEGKMWTGKGIAGGMSYEEHSIPWIKNGRCVNNGTYACQLGYACDGCPYNGEPIRVKFIKDGVIIFEGVPKVEISEEDDI